MLMRVPLLAGGLLFFLPWLSRQRSCQPLLLGLFDITPLSTIAVALASMSTATIVIDNARLILLHSYNRHIGGLMASPEAVSGLVWLGAILILGLPTICYAVYVSNQQNAGFLARRVTFALLTVGAELLSQALVVHAFRFGSSKIAWRLTEPATLVGYAPWADHVAALASFSLSLVVYLGLGLYGLTRLGKKATVPALCSLLMVMMLLCSALSALSFFLDLWHVPLLLTLIAWGFVTAQCKQSDHFYDLVSKSPNHLPAPTPLEVVKAAQARKPGRIIVVAANGGGIQAGAWAAKVLESLTLQFPDFAGSLRLISSVSGGSLGNICYVYNQAHLKGRGAFAAASESSLDEVSWGVSWPDLIGSVFPWMAKNFIGRGEALERAWIASVQPDQPGSSQLGKPLSDWNTGVRNGTLPAVILNATLVETGQRLLMATTQLRQSANFRARVDASQLHGPDHDVAAVTAARLSATFPYVTPAARARADRLMPHVVDGGYYDNYGMATLVEWLDEALSDDFAAADRAIESVLVIQIHGAPVTENNDPYSARLSQHGWFFQIFAPLATLSHVRGAGQIAHNDLELGQLQQRWLGKIPVHTVTVEFPGQEAPLSWHLTRCQQQSIEQYWNSGSFQNQRALVDEFLQGNDRLNCPCPTCQPPHRSFETAA